MVIGLEKVQKMIEYKNANQLFNPVFINSTPVVVSFINASSSWSK